MLVLTTLSLKRMFAILIGLYVGNSDVQIRVLVHGVWEGSRSWCPKTYRSPVSYFTGGALKLWTRRVVLPVADSNFK